MKIRVGDKVRVKEGRPYGSSYSAAGSDPGGSTKHVSKGGQYDAFTVTSIVVRDDVAHAYEESTDAVGWNLMGALVDDLELLKRGPEPAPTPPRDRGPKTEDLRALEFLSSLRTGTALQGELTGLGFSRSRLERMVRRGWLVEDDRMFTITPAGRELLPARTGNLADLKGSLMPPP